MVRRVGVLVLVVVAFAAAAGAARAAVLTVTSTADSGAGTLRQAILDANASPGADTIDFDISGDGVHTIAPLSPLPAITDPVAIDGYSQPGAGTNTATTGDNAVLEIELSASACACAFNPALYLSAGPSSVRGLVIDGSWNAGVWLEGSDGSTIAGDVIGLTPAGAPAGMAGNGVVVSGSANNIVGGPDPADRNIVDENGTGFAGTSGIAVGGVGATGNTIENDYVGVDATGTAALGNPGTGVGISAPGALLEDSVISGNGGDGVDITGYGGDVVRGNMIGADVTGHAALGNGGIGVALSGGATSNTIGGTDASARNVIVANGSLGVSLTSGDAVSQNDVVEGNYIGTDGSHDLGNNLDGISVNGGQGLGDVFAHNVISGNGSTYENGNGCTCSSGISLFSHPSGITIQGNLIGVGSDGSTPIPNAGRGLDLADGSDVTVGGPDPGDGNVIAHNGEEPGEAGIDISTGTGDSILGNSIHDNTGLGIDLNDNGAVDPNDAGDGDGGGNGTQNFPLLTHASSSAGETTVDGSLNSTPGTTFRVEIFGNASCDPSGNGEGQTYLGSTSVTTDGAGDATINASLGVGTPVGGFVTATATDPAGDTSEFSACTPVASSAGSADLVLTNTAAPDAVLAGQTVTYVLTVVNAGPDDASDVVLTDPLPAGLVQVSVSSSAGSCTGGATVSVVCDLGTIADGGSAVVTIAATVAGDGRTMTDTATVSSSASDPRPASNTASAAVSVTSAADVSLRLFASPGAVSAGNDVSYRLDVFDSGPSTTDAVVVDIALPPDAPLESGVGSAAGCASYDSFGNLHLVCTVGPLAGSSSAELTFALRPQAPGTLSTTAEITDPGITDTEPLDNTASITTTVLPPQPPTVSGFSTSDAVPVTAGAVDAHVRVTGVNLGTAYEVDFGGVAASQLNVVSPTEVDAVVPIGAKNGPLTVKTTGGSATSAGSFTVIRVTGISPTTVSVGTTVTITGGPFYGANYAVGSVYLGGARASAITVPSSSEILAVVPAGAVNGHVDVAETNGAGLVVSPQQFGFRPQVSDVYNDANHAVRGGVAGSKIDIVGSHLDGGQVFFNGTQSTQIAGGGGLLVATIPDGASTGKVTVKTAGGSVTSTQTLTVERITGLSSTSGYMGTTLTISGDGFSGADSGGVEGAAIGSVGMAARVVSAHEVQLTVAPSVTQGNVTLLTAFGRTASSQTFTRSLLQITGVSPASAAPGETVTITGHGFWSQVPFRIDFGSPDGSTVPATVVSPTELAAVVPANAQSNVVTVEDPFDPKAGHLFYVIPDILTVSSHLFPGEIGGIAGSQVDIGGAGFFSARFTLNGLPLTVDERTATHVLATLPAGASSGHLVGTTGGPSDTSVDLLPIERITGFSPSQGPVDTLLTISGVAFGTSGWNRVGSVAVGGVATRAFTVPSSGQVKLLVPRGAVSGRITIRTPLGTIVSAGTFTVSGAASAGRTWPSGQRRFGQLRTLLRIERLLVGLGAR